MDNNNYYKSTLGCKPPDMLCTDDCPFVLGDLLTVIHSSGQGDKETMRVISIPALSPSALWPHRVSFVSVSQCMLVSSQTMACPWLDAWNIDVPYGFVKQIC